MLSVFRAIGIVVAGFLLVGFGLCGLTGVTMGIVTLRSPGAGVMFAWGLGGLAIAGAAGWAIMRLNRMGKPRKLPVAAPDPQEPPA